TKPFVRSVVEVAHRRFEVARERFGVDRVAMIVRRYQDLTAAQIEHRLIAAAMAVGQLVGPCTAGQREQLMSQTDAEERLAADETAKQIDGGAEVRRVTGTGRDDNGCRL